MMEAIDIINSLIDCRAELEASKDREAASRAEVKRLRDAALEIDKCFRSGVLSSFGTRGSLARDVLRDALAPNPPEVKP